MGAQARGLGSRLASGLAVAATALLRATSKIFGELRERSGQAYGGFRARPEHARWRAYALGSYGLVILATLLAQLYSFNPLGAYVRVQPVVLPAATIIFVRNDSKEAWTNVKLTLNGIYTHERNELAPRANVALPVTRFAIFDPTGKPTFAPKDIALRTLAIDCDRGHYEAELKQ